MYLDLLTTAALVDPHLFSGGFDTLASADSVTTATELAAKKKGKGKGLLIIGGICCLIVVVLIVGGIYLLKNKKKDDQPPAQPPFDGPQGPQSPSTGTPFGKP